MDLENRNKEELIGIIRELQTSYNALKEYFDQDQSFLREAEEKIRRSEEKFRTAFMTSPDAIIISRASDGLIVAVNESFTRITGYSEAEIAGKLSSDVNLWNDIKDRMLLVKELLEHGKVDNFETVFKKKDRTVFTGLVSAAIIEINGEKCVGCMSCVNIAPGFFKFDDQKNIARVKKQPPDRITKKVKLAIQSCPVEAISLKK